MKNNTPHRYVATGFSGNGMSYGTLAGMILSDLITEKKNPYEKLYRPYRHMHLIDVILKGREYMSEFFHGLVQHIPTKKK